MKTFKLLLLALAFTLSTGTFAKDGNKFSDEISLTSEISKFVKERSCDLSEDLRVTVFFSVSEDKKTQQVNVASSNEEINNLLEQKLNGQDLLGDSWKMGKVYEISVVVRSQTT